MLNPAKHEILNAHKNKNIKKFRFFGGSDEPSILFFLLINVKMPIIVGILTFMSGKNFMLAELSIKSFYNLGASNAELQIRGGIEDNSAIIFNFSTNAVSPH